MPFLKGLEVLPAEECWSVFGASAVFFEGFLFGFRGLGYGGLIGFRGFWGSVECEGVVF